MRQVVFTDVLNVVRLDVDGHSFAPIGLNQKDAASDWLLIKHHCIYERLAGSLVIKLIGLSNQCDFSIYRQEDVFFQLKIRGASEKFKNQPQPLLRPRSANFRQHFRNLSCKTVHLSLFSSD